jgi:hypothetical protein
MKHLIHKIFVVVIHLEYQMLNTTSWSNTHIHSFSAFLFVWHLVHFLHADHFIREIKSNMLWMGEVSGRKTHMTITIFYVMSFHLLVLLLLFITTCHVDILNMADENVTLNNLNPITSVMWKVSFILMSLSFLLINGGSGWLIYIQWDGSAQYLYNL